VSEQPDPPRVRVTLPDGRVVTGRILRWRQGPDGEWWAEATWYVPAGAVQQVEGEDYSAVPREPAGPRYVLSTDDRRPPGTKPTMELHLADCFTLGQIAAWTRITPVPSAERARGMLQFDDTTPCDVCKPDP
jgi:hypothetical protein